MPIAITTLLMLMLRCGRERYEERDAREPPAAKTNVSAATPVTR